MLVSLHGNSVPAEGVEDVRGTGEVEHHLGRPGVLHAINLRVHAWVIHPHTTGCFDTAHQWQHVLLDALENVRAVCVTWPWMREAMARYQAV